MSGISPRLPLERNTVDGAYGLNKNYIQIVKQNFKMLILTNQGEKCMDPLFGCSIRRLLFENISPNIKETIQETILKQVEKYMPFLSVNNIDVQTVDNTLNVRIFYTIIPLSVSDVLEILN